MMPRSVLAAREHGTMRRGRSARTPPAASVRLRVEALEDRTLPSGVGLVPDNATHAVTVFDPDTHVVLGNVSLSDPGLSIGDVAILANGSKGFVTDFDERVFPIDLATPSAPALGAAIPIATLA